MWKVEEVAAIGWWWKMLSRMSDVMDKGHQLVYVCACQGSIKCRDER
jgi:hypothetical protein